MGRTHEGLRNLEFLLQDGRHCCSPDTRQISSEVGLLHLVQPFFDLIQVYILDDIRENVLEASAYPGYSTTCYSFAVSRLCNAKLCNIFERYSIYFPILPHEPGWFRREGHARESTGFQRFTSREQATCRHVGQQKRQPEAPSTSGHMDRYVCQCLDCLMPSVRHR